MTVVAVMYAYMSDSMSEPEMYLSEIDKRFISNFQEAFAKLGSKSESRTTTRFWSRFGGLAKQLLAKLLPESKKKERHKKLNRAQREEAITRFILALSDQQLAVGLAILIAIITNQCTLSVAEFRIAFALAWFSTSTHLATLDSLRHYFVCHQTIRNWRIL